MVAIHRVFANIFFSCLQGPATHDRDTSHQHSAVEDSTSAIKFTGSGRQPQRPQQQLHYSHLRFDNDIGELTATALFAGLRTDEEASTGGVDIAITYPPSGHPPSEHADFTDTCRTSRMHTARTRRGKNNSRSSTQRRRERDRPREARSGVAPTTKVRKAAANSHVGHE